ncbi:MAG: DoxX family protein [Cyclobacteriaceae bacterium]
MKKFKIAYYVVTGLLSLMLLYSSIGMYLLQTDMVKGFFEALGFPTFIVIPLAIAKITGVVVLLTRFNDTIKEWAYAGFFFNFVLAAAAHINVGDGEAGGAIMALVLLAVSYILDKKAFMASLN